MADPAATLISIDFTGGDFGISPSNADCKLYATFGYPEQRLELIRQSSMRQDTLTMLKEMLGGREIDLLYLDGDHTYAGIKSDYERYEPLVAKDGIVALHDIWEIPEEVPYWRRANEASIFWQELSPKVSSREIVDSRFPPAQWNGHETRSRLWPPVGIGLVLGNRGTERPQGT
jgi:predicted O-methyltransferase YrrM